MEQDSKNQLSLPEPPDLGIVAVSQHVEVAEARFLGNAIKTVFVAILSFALFWVLWNQFNPNNNFFQANLIRPESAQKLIIKPQKSTLSPGESVELSVSGVFSYGEVPLPAQWRLDNPMIGSLDCNTKASLKCIFRAYKTEVAKVGYLVVTASGSATRVKLKVLPSNLQLVSFIDISPTDWYFSALHYLAAYPRIVNVFDGDEFLALNDLTRAEWVEMVEAALLEKGLLARGRTKDTCQQSFSDVPIDHPAARALCRFFSQGWISGISIDQERYFKPDDPITREQAGKILCSTFCSYLENAFQLLHKEYQSFYFKDASLPFNIDLSHEQPTSLGLIKLALYGIFQKNDLQKIEPQKVMNRAEAIMLLQRVLTVFDQKILSSNGSQQIPVLDAMRLELKQPQPENSAQDSNVLTSLNPTNGDGSEKIFFESKIRTGMIKMLAFSYSYNGENESAPFGVASYPVGTSSDGSKDVLVLDSFQTQGEIILFREVYDGNLSNSLEFETVHQDGPHISEITPISGTEREHFVIKGFQLGNSENNILEGLVFRIPEDLEDQQDENKRPDLVERFIQDSTAFWSDTEIWFSVLDSNDIKTGDIIKFRVIGDTGNEQNISSKSNTLAYTVDLDAKPVLYSLSTEVGNPSEPLSISGRNFGQSPFDNAASRLSYSCLQRGEGNFRALSFGEVPIDVIEVWKNDIITVSSLSNLCKGLLVGDKIAFQVESGEKISNGLEFTLFNKKIPNPVIDSITPGSGDGKSEIILNGRYLGAPGKVFISYFFPDQDRFVNGGTLQASQWEYEKIVLSSLPVQGSQVHIYIVTRGLRSNTVIYKIE